MYSAPVRRLPSAFFLGACCLLLTLLWLPGLRYPILSDTAIYALLGKSVWEHGRYLLLGVPYAKHLPLQAVVSYPLNALLGFQLGMKLCTLLAGFGVIIVSFLLLRRTFPPAVAWVSALVITLHPAFILMTQMGSADLLFTFLFLASVYAYLLAGKHTPFYPAAFLCLGLACLTRYNGLPVLPLFLLWTAWKRPAHLRDPFFVGGALLGTVLCASWFIRNQLVLGNAFQTEYAGELGTQSPDHLHQLVSNFFYYLNPIHNILPFLFPFTFYGLWRFGRERVFLLLCIAAVWALTAIWWVQAMRFAFPAYPLVIGFAVAGLLDLLHRWPKCFVSGAVCAAILFLGVQLPSLCIYTYGSCNAWFDRTIGWLPKDLGLTPEGFYSSAQARDWLLLHAETGSTMVTDDPVSAAVWQTGVFRPDMRVMGTFDGHCPAYRFAVRPPPEDTSVFASDDAPVTHVDLLPCPATARP